LLAALGIGALALGMVLENALALAAGIAALGCQFLLSLAIREATGVVPAAIYGAALLLVAELAHWSLELGWHFQSDAEVLRRRGSAIAMLVAASLLVGLGAAAVAGTALPGSVLLTALGVGSVLALIALLTVLLWERRDEGR
jgi:hypothetical protein